MEALTDFQGVYCHALGEPISVLTLPRIWLPLLLMEGIHVVLYGKEKILISVILDSMISDLPYQNTYR